MLLIDEFQEVERVAKNQGIEGAMRYVAQETESFAIIFSGSKRSLLKSMFHDRNKPLYRLCDEIVLDRIGENDYFDFVNKFAKKKWRQPIPPETFHYIIDAPNNTLIILMLYYDQSFYRRPYLLRRTLLILGFN